MLIANKKVSIIILTYNRSEQLRRCVDSLILSTYKNFEIIIVNNNSSDNTKQVANSLSKKYSNIIFINLNKNLMAAGGRNEGIKHSSGDYLLFVDDDNVVDPNMIDELVKEMDAHLDIGLIGPIMFFYKSPNMIYHCRNSINYITSKTTYYFNNKDITNVKLSKRINTNHIPNVFMTRKTVLDKIGLFDETYKIMYEESDLAMRIKKAGYNIEVVTDAITYHDVLLPNEAKQDELKRLGVGTPERAYHFAKNRNIFVKKYFPWYGKLTYNIIFKRLFVVFYVYKCIKNKRMDIAKAYLKGSKYNINSM